MAKRTAPEKERDLDTREKEDRVVEYRPPTNLPDPLPQDGYEFRWIRTAVLGDPDNQNVSMRFREGWEACLAEDHPELMLMSDVNSTFEGNIVIGGLMLCKCLTEQMEARSFYFDKLAKRQEESVDQNFMRENDPRMPLLQTDIRVTESTTTTFGAGRSSR
jgi:hypothetical protein